MISNDKRPTSPTDETPESPVMLSDTTRAYLERLNSYAESNGKPAATRQSSSKRSWWNAPFIAMFIAVVFMVGMVSFGFGASSINAAKSGSVASSSSSNTTSNSMPASTSSSSTSATAPTVAHQTYNPKAPATLQGSTVNVTLTVKELLVSIAPGVVYHAWTFDGTVPGPVIRVRQGQTIHFTLVNDGNMPHSIDFHAAQTPWNVNYKEIPAGKSFSFDWKADYPGVFMYHCGAPVTIYHMANGMYGSIIVDPAQGWVPAQEYVLVQSEFYTSQQADGTYLIDNAKLTAGNPDYVVFNGYANQYQTTPIVAKAGERIRIFIVNAGPTLFSAFHVVGAIFSDSYADGNPANHMVGNQTVTIPPGGGMMVELTIPQPGLYPFVTHSFNGVGKGAVGVLKIIP
ncbi:MAG TPA: multicopper oxidase domain-containing protein [Ktedonobacteraceae bacterium]|nr:multicopper oxidase domain-containing protein [Ktedonobacteraceae bacterium]